MRHIRIYSVIILVLSVHSSVNCDEHTHRVKYFLCYFLPLHLNYVHVTFSASLFTFLQLEGSYV